MPTSCSRPGHTHVWPSLLELNNGTAVLNIEPCERHCGISPRSPAPYPRSHAHSHVLNGKEFRLRVIPDSGRRGQITNRELDDLDRKYGQSEQDRVRAEEEADAAPGGETESSGDEEEWELLTRVPLAGIPEPSRAPPSRLVNPAPNPFSKNREPVVKTEVKTEVENVKIEVKPREVEQDIYGISDDEAPAKRRAQRPAPPILEIPQLVDPEFFVSELEDEEVRVKKESCECGGRRPQRPPYLWCECWIMKEEEDT